MGTTVIPEWGLDRARIAGDVSVIVIVTACVIVASRVAR